MRKATTIGFAVDPADRERLDHLAEVFGGGNRSEFLRRAMTVMERLESAQRIAELQAYGEQRLADSGWVLTDVPRIVERALADPDPIAVAEAKLLIAGIRDRSRISRAPSSERDLDESEVAFREAVAELHER